MNDAIILQNANSKGGGEYFPHLAVSVPIHAAYAKRHNFDYRVEFGDVSEFGSKTVGGYSKLDMILDVIFKYRHIVWIDCDAMITDHSCDLRSALAPSWHVGAVRFSKPVPHYNVGVLYLRGTEEASRFIRAVRDLPPVNDWYEQHSFNVLAADPRFSSIFQELPSKWNSWVYEENGFKDAVIRGYHGGSTKREKFFALAGDSLRHCGVLHA